MAKNFSRDVAAKLLDKLSTDDAFRERFRSDPRAALAEVGHVTPEEDVGKEGVDPVMCCDNLMLASKEEIGKAKGKLEAQLSSAIFHYEVAV